MAPLSPWGLSDFSEITFEILLNTHFRNIRNDISALRQALREDLSYERDTIFDPQTLPPPIIYRLKTPNPIEFNSHWEPIASTNPFYGEVMGLQSGVCGLGYLLKLLGNASNLGCIRFVGYENDYVR